MKRYWDLTEKARAELTREQVEEFTRYELMERGVLAVAPLELEPEPEVELPPTRVYYRPSRRDGKFVYNEWDICFETREQVEQFLRLKPIQIGVHWFGNGQSMLSAEPGSKELSFQVVHLANEDDVTQAAHKLALLAATRERNEKRRQVHERDTRLQQEALTRLWANWDLCREKRAKLQRVIDTWREYQELAGDPVKARLFLGKVFSGAEVEDAAEWFGVEIPSAEPAQDAVEFESMGMKVAFAPGE